MALRLTDNDICSERVSQQVEHLSSKAREAKNMALELRQKHLDAKLQVKDRPVVFYSFVRLRALELGSNTSPFRFQLKDPEELEPAWR